jgi:rhodanese-related sulfurtransferase
MDRLEKDMWRAGKMLDNGAVLVDIREWEEVETVAFDAKEILHLPYSHLSERLDEIPAQREVIIGCRSGKRSLEAVLFLRERGYERVYSLRGGINEWIAGDFLVKWDFVWPEGAMAVSEKK